MRTVGKEFHKKPKKPTKKEVMEILKEKGIEFDDNAKLDDLITLLPKEQD